MLIEAGALRGGRATAADWERVGEEYAFTGIVGRVRLRYDGEIEPAFAPRLYHRAADSRLHRPSSCSRT